MEWYDELNKSPLTPPNYVFSVVWTVLYILMFVGLFRTYKNPYIIAIFLIQLALNVSWSPIFFNYHAVGLSMIVICLLICCVISMAYMFYQYDELSGLMQIPYIIWLFIAGYLNWYVLSHN